MAIEKKLICFARLEEFERQLAAGNILDYSIVFIQDAKKIWTRGTYYDCNNVAPDWNAQEGEEGYIENRTHYKHVINMELERQEQYDEVEDYFWNTWGGEYNSIKINTFPAEIVIEGGGHKWTVTLGSKNSYDVLNVIEMDNLVNIAKVYLVEVEENYYLEISDKGYENHTLYDTLNVNYNEYLKLSEKYIPDTIARLADIPKGAKVYTWNWDGTMSGTFTEEEFENLLNADSICISVNVAGMEVLYSVDGRAVVEDALRLSVHSLTFEMIDNNKAASVDNITYIFDNASKIWSVQGGNAELITTEQLTSALEGKQNIIEDLNIIRQNANDGESAYRAILDGDVLSSDGLKTINGESIVGSGDIVIEGGETLTESDIAAMGFTKNTGTYSKPSGGIPKTDLASAVQTSLGKADTALQSYTEQYKGTVTGVKINGTTKNPSSGVVDLGTVITAHQDISGKQDKLVSGTNIKTVNGQSLLGSGDITISGGSSSGGSGAYSEVNHGTADTTFTLTPNTFHVWDEVASLTLDFGSETSGVANEFLFQFTSGSTATSLTLPDDIKWANDSAPTIAENMIYQVSILKGLASVLEFSNAVALIENRGTYTAGTMTSGATITFEYPVASDLTIEFQHTQSPSYTLQAGETTLYIDWYEPAAPVPLSVMPLQDNTYVYIIV